MPGVKGQRSGGHNRKTTTKLQQDGGYRTTRHASRADVMVKPAAIAKPDDLGEAGSKLWDRFVSSLPAKLLTDMDVESLVMFARLADNYAALQPLFAADPLDKETRIAFLAVVDRMDKLGRQFGWTPQSRAGLTLPGNDKGTESGFEALLERMSGRN